MDKLSLGYFIQGIHSNIIEKGKKLIQSNVTIQRNEKGHVSANVKSASDPSVNYRVNLILADNKKINYSCTCPHAEEGNLCKHVYAVAAHVYMNLPRPIKVVAQVDAKNVFDSANIELQYAPITEEFIKQHSNGHTFSKVKAHFSNDIVRLQVYYAFKGVLKCYFEQKGYWGWDKIHQLSFEVLESGVLKMSCTCNQKVAALCEHKHFALQLMSDHFKKPDFLMEFEDEKNAKNNALLPYNFTTEDVGVDELFEFHFDGKGVLVAQPQDPSLKSMLTNESLLSILNLSKRSETSLLALESEYTQAKEKKLAVVFMSQSNNRKNITLPKISFIVGELNNAGTKLVKGIKTLDDAVLNKEQIPVFNQNQLEISKILSEFKHNNIDKFINKLITENADVEMGVANYISDRLRSLKKHLKEEMVYVSSDYYIRKKSLREVSIQEETPEISLSLKEVEPPFVALCAHLEIGDKQIPFFNPYDMMDEDGDDYEFDEFDEDENEYDEDDFLDGDGLIIQPNYFVYNNKVVLVTNAETNHHISFFKANSIIKVHKNQEEQLIKDILLPMSKYHKVNMPEDKIEYKDAYSPALSVYLSETGNFLIIKPIVNYDEGEVELFSEDKIIKNEGKKYVSYRRDELFENQIKEVLISSHPDFPEQQDRGFLYVHFDQILKNDWYFTFFQMLKDREIPVFGMDKIKRSKYSPYKPQTKTNVSSGINWFDVGMEVDFGNQQVSLKDLQKALVKKQNYVQLGDGSLGLLPDEWLKKYSDLLQNSTVDKEGKMKISKFHFTLLDNMIEDIDEEAIAQEIYEKKVRLLNFDGIKSQKLPKKSTATLRPYQEAGYNWLMFLDEYGWGGCLADDMGLGKTLQIITFLQRQAELHPKKTNLVVVPTTLLFNWKRELQKFAPELSYLDHTGLQRSKEIDAFKEYNIVLTTYGLIINDIELLVKMKFNYVILDESQAIKNPDSQRYKAVSLLKTRSRIVMSGTPVENNTFDLYAQMNFTNPGLLGNMNSFKNNYSTAIDKQGDKDAAERLRKLISPFLLRRTKSQVATDLPDKTEDLIICEMEPEQRKVYNAFRDKYREMITEKIDSEGLGKSSMYVLDALLKLRQICNSPALMNTEEDYGDASIKLKELVRHLTEKTGKHKVLIFSQFTKMLKLIEREIGKLAINYEYLDGGTANKEREKIVYRFQNDENIRVMLISLKAGGVGLNLTEADYVYLIDPWWNPAVEAQAIDRTHRIGQNKKVFAYRMICKDTIEEKVLQLQDAKRSLAQDLISTEAAFYKQLGKDDVLELFS